MFIILQITTKNVKKNKKFEKRTLLNTFQNLLINIYFAKKATIFIKNTNLIEQFKDFTLLFNI